MANSVSLSYAGIHNGRALSRTLIKMDNRSQKKVGKGGVSLPVVLMVDKGLASDRGMLANWLEQSRFLSCDAVDVFEAVEEMADFTVRDRPDVIVLDVDCCSENVDLVRTVLSSDRATPPILTLTKKNEKCLDLSALSARLDTLIPKQPLMH
jgi:DNA-binding response OmpR family regulator